MVQETHGTGRNSPVAARFRFARIRQQVHDIYWGQIMQSSVRTGLLLSGSAIAFIAVCNASIAQEPATPPSRAPETATPPTAPETTVPAPTGPQTNMPQITVQEFEFETSEPSVSSRAAFALDAHGGHRKSNCSGIKHECKWP